MEEGGFLPLLVRGVSAAAKGSKGAVVATKAVSKSKLKKQLQDEAWAAKNEYDKQTKAERRRGEIVRQVMNEKGLSMIEASKYVKEHNLY